MDDLNVSWLFDQILRTRLHAVMGGLILWGVIGFFSGAFLSVVVSCVLVRMGAIRLAWRHGIWLKMLAIVWIIVTCSVLGCVTGLIEGAFRGVRIVVSESSFRSGVLLPLGAQFSTQIAYMDCLLAQAQQRSNSEDPLKLSHMQEAYLKRFREGTAELDVPVFLSRIEHAEATFVQEVLREGLARIQADKAIKTGGLTDTILQRFLPNVIQWGIRRKAKNELDKVGMGECVTQFMENLQEAAAKNGDSATMSFDELTVYSVDHGVIPAIMCPTRSLARGKQIGTGVLALAAIFLPVLLFWLGRLRERRKQIEA